MKSLINNASKKLHCNKVAAGLGAAFIAIAILGCSEKSESIEAYSEPAYSKQYRNQALTTVVSLSETNIPTSGKITLMLEVHTPDGVEPDFPIIENFIEPFRVADGYSEPIQTLPNGKSLHRKVWVLVPGSPGGFAFQSLEIQAGLDQIKTDPISVTVTSLLPPGNDELKIRDIAEPVELLPEQQKKRRSIYTVIGTILVLALIPFILSLLRKPKIEPTLLPHETAFQSLENLPEDPVQRIHELNRIFRAYHEARFGVPMIGKTAVELSVVLEDTDTIRFLETCDDIRFSNKVPDGFVNEAEQFVRSTIEKTMEVTE